MKVWLRSAACAVAVTLAAASAALAWLMVILFVVVWFALWSNAQAAIFGIRPEDVHAEQSDPGWQAIDVEVIALETLGAEVVLIAAIPGLDGIDFAARLGRHYRAPIGSMQRLYLDLAEMHLFDPRTTMAVPRDM